MSAVSDQLTRVATVATAAPVFWLTGLSGAGKSTLAGLVGERLSREGARSIVIDGDVLRDGLSSDLGFTAEDRAENVRRAAEVAVLCANAGVVTFVALVSPFEADRQNARRIIGSRFFEIFLTANFSVCSQRDVKGLYRQAAAGKIADFTGLSSPYEVPARPDLVIDTMTRGVEACACGLLDYARARI